MTQKEATMGKITTGDLYRSVLTFQDGVLRNADRIADLALAVTAAVHKIDAAVESSRRLEERVDARLAGVDQRLIDMDRRLDERLGHMDERLNGMDARLERMDSKLDQMMLILAELRHPGR